MAGKSQEHKLYAERRAARELAANIIYRLLLTDPVDEHYARRLHLLAEAADRVPLQIGSLLGGECFGVFGRLCGIHKAAVRKALAAGSGPEELSLALDRRLGRLTCGEVLRVRRDRREEPYKVCPVHKRLSLTLAQEVLADCAGEDRLSGPAEEVSAMLDDPATAEDAVFGPAADMLGKVSDREASKARIMDYARFLAGGALQLREEIDGFIAGFSDKYTPDRIQPSVKAFILLAAFEGTSAEGVDFAVAVNEALELLKIYAGDDSVRFVNALLQDYYDTRKDISHGTTP
ncbi:MAG: hypothetical protein IK083_05305 [Abditibacteriota bacterium]|nr:hypothetical protein [Abditibacteriota bacterium]